MLKENDKVGAFKIPDQDGNIVKLSDYKGQWVLIYFYPKDSTPGCTKEACSMQDHLSKFNKLELNVLGVSTDSIQSHKKFADKYKLKFPLLADEEKELVKMFGVWGLKKFMGREYLGIKRTSFLIDPKGKVAKVYSKVKPAEHAAEVLQDVKELQKG